MSNSATDGLAHYPSNRYLEDGSYFKLSTVTLGYTFRNCFNGWLRDIRVYVSANNVFTITGYKGRDPEINLGGLEPGHDTRWNIIPALVRFSLVSTSILRKHRIFKIKPKNDHEIIYKSVDAGHSFHWNDRLHRPQYRP